jgi:hypothetical protein
MRDTVPSGQTAVLNSEARRFWRLGLLPILTVIAVTAGALVLTEIPALAEAGQCDYITGMGWFNTSADQTHPLAKASFAIAAGCKDGVPTWGSLEYTDRGNGLNLIWTSITGYIWFGNDGPDPKTGKPHGARIICGTATTNLFGAVDFGVVAYDASEPGIDDVFIIRLRKDGHTVYSTEHPREDFTLGGTSKGGGNIQLSDPTPGFFTSNNSSCAALF